MGLLCEKQEPHALILNIFPLILLIYLGGYPNCIHLKYVKNSCKGGRFMRKIYLDNVRWMTVVLVVIYHVVFMFNGVSTAGVIGPFRDFSHRIHISTLYIRGLCCYCLLFPA